MDVGREILFEVLENVKLRFFNKTGKLLTSRNLKYLVLELNLFVNEQLFTPKFFKDKMKELETAKAKITIDSRRFKILVAYSEGMERYKEE